jgi:hypothetical protein
MLIHRSSKSAQSIFALKAQETSDANMKIRLKLIRVPVPFSNESLFPAEQTGQSNPALTGPGNKRSVVYGLRDVHLRVCRS